MGMMLGVKVARLVPFRHPCSDVQHCGGIIIKSTEGSRKGAVLKFILAIPEIHMSRFVDSIEQAQKWAADHKITISDEDIAACEAAIPKT